MSRQIARTKVSKRASRGSIVHISCGLLASISLPMPDGRVSSRQSRYSHFHFRHVGLQFQKVTGILHKGRTEWPQMECVNQLVSAGWSLVVQCHRVLQQSPFGMVGDLKLARCPMHLMKASKHLQIRPAKHIT